MTPNPSPGTSAVALRPSTPSDEPFLRRLYASTREGELAQVPWPAEGKAAFLDMQFRAQAMHYEREYPDCEYHVIEVGGAAAGRLYVDRGETEIHILDIALLPGYRGAGIGSALLAEILDEARRTDRTVGIYVESYNPARRLYDRLGFHDLGTNGVYHRMEWRPAEATLR